MIGEIIGGALGAIGGIFGGMGANARAKRMQEMVERQKSANNDWYNRRYNEDATQRADAQRMITLAGERFRERNKQAEATAAVMGGTDASVALQKEANAKAMAEMEAQIAAQGEARKDAIEKTYLKRNDNYDQALLDIEGEKKSGWDMAAGAIGGAAQALGGGLG
jgi:hypothetical protein